MGIEGGYSRCSFSRVSPIRKTHTSRCCTLSANSDESLARQDAIINGRNNKMAVEPSVSESARTSSKFRKQTRSRSRHRERGVAPIIVIIVVVVVVAVVLIGVSYVASSPTPTETIPPSPGCFPAGTQCRVFIQNEVQCCGGTPVVGKRVGACIGWYDALPCR